MCFVVLSLALLVFSCGFYQHHRPGGTWHFGYSFPSCSLLFYEQVRLSLYAVQSICKIGVIHFHSKYFTFFHEATKCAFIRTYRTPSNSSHPAGLSAPYFMWYDIVPFLFLVSCPSGISMTAMQGFCGELAKLRVLESCALTAHGSHPPSSCCELASRHNVHTW